MKNGKHIIVLACGNDLLCDDAVGLHAARAIKTAIVGEVSVVECEGLGLHLLETLEGHDKALLLDAVMTCLHPVGTILEFTKDDVAEETSSSPHYAGLAEVFQMAARLNISFPSEIKILAMEVADPYQIGQEFTPGVAQAMPEFIRRAEKILESWGVGIKEPS